MPRESSSAPTTSSSTTPKDGASSNVCTASKLPTLGRGLKWLSPPQENGPAKLDKQQSETSQRYTRPEKVLKYTWDGESKKWVQTQAMVQISVGPFDRGYTRTVYRMRELVMSENNNNANSGSETGSYHDLVCKVLDAKILSGLIGPVTEKMYLADARCAIVAQEYAAMFNETDPPQKIEFCENALMRLQERPGKPLVAVERFMHGKFVKHNNNNGAVLSSRMTPQAFSHFSHFKSDGRILICDVQGWDNIFTDPQVHSLDGKYGLGNQGKKGMRKFFRTHTCGVICGLLGLPRLAHGRSSGRWTRDEIISQLKSLNLSIPPKFGGAAKNGDVSPTDTCQQQSCSIPKPQFQRQPSLNSKQSSQQQQQSQQSKPQSAEYISTSSACASGSSLPSLGNAASGDQYGEDWRCESPEIYSEEDDSGADFSEDDDDDDSQEPASSQNQLDELDVAFVDAFAVADPCILLHRPLPVGSNNSSSSSGGALGRHYLRSATVDTAASSLSSQNRESATVESVTGVSNKQDPQVPHLQELIKQRDEEIVSLRNQLSHQQELTHTLQLHIEDAQKREAAARNEIRELRERTDKREGECYTLRAELMRRRQEHCQQLLDMRKELSSLRHDVVVHEKTIINNSNNCSDTNNIKDCLLSQNLRVSHC